MTIRETDSERDARALVVLERETDPVALSTVASWLHRERTIPARAQLRAFVAEVDGEVVGESYALRTWWAADGAVLIHVAVRECASRRGIGSALWERAYAHAQTLKPTKLTSRFVENPAGVAFATALGFTEARAEKFSTVDPRTVDEEHTAEVRPAAEVDSHVLHRIDDEATPDVPGHENDEPIPFDEWAEYVLGHPLYQPHGSFVAYADGEPVALSILVADLESGRGGTMVTGTLAPYRGRGLARAAKIASLRWAAAHGVTSMETTNDETNAPMLAINRRLGYAPAGRRVWYVKLSGSSGSTPTGS